MFYRRSGRLNSHAHPKESPNCGSIWPSNDPACLFLNRNLLFNLSPSADFQPATHPAQGLIARTHSLRIANRALGSLLEAVGGNRALRLFEKFRRYRHGKLRGFESLGAFRRRWNLRLRLHAIPLFVFTMAETSTTDNYRCGN